MSVHFHKSSQFEERRSQIELHLFDSILEIEKELHLALRSVEQFAFAIDRLMDMLEQMYPHFTKKVYQFLIKPIKQEFKNIQFGSNLRLIARNYAHRGQCCLRIGKRLTERWVQGLRMGFVIRGRGH